MAQTAEVAEQQPAVARRPLQRRSTRRIVLRMTIDAMAVAAALFIASIIRFEIIPGAPALRHGWSYTSITLLAAPIWVLLFYLYGLYEPRQVLSPVNEFKQVFHGVVAGGVAIFIADSLLDLNLARGWALIALVSGFVLVGGE